MQSNKEHLQVIQIIMQQKLWLSHNTKSWGWDIGQQMMSGEFIWVNYWYNNKILKHGRYKIMMFNVEVINVPVISITTLTEVSEINGGCEIRSCGFKSWLVQILPNNNIRKTVNFSNPSFLYL